MKQCTILILTFIISTSHLFAQKISETGFEASVNLISIPKLERYWNLNESTPIFLSVGGLKSWYNTSHLISLRKEIGASIQFEDVNFSGGGLGAQGGYEGNIYSLFINPALLAHFQFSKTFSTDIGPAMDFLVLGFNDLVHWSHSGEIYNNFNKELKSSNRYHFKVPSFGIKSRFTIFCPVENVNFGFTFAYLWTKENYSNFYIKNYTKIGLYISFNNSLTSRKKN
jgi:hypothetical protein